MGLAISRHLVELMGGRIWVDSELGMGATFGFTFMARQGDDGENRLLLNNGYWANKRALVADDAPNILVYFRSEASRLSISCDVALSGEAALEMIEKNDPYDICFIDWKLPGMNGIEAAARIREMGAGKPQIILMISAAEWKLMEEDARKAGVEHYLQKPLFRSDIIDCLNGCFGPKPAQEAQTRDKKDNFEGFHVLIVEDLEINREIVLAYLEPTGLAIDCAENGKAAVKMVMAAEKPYDIIFMDLQMPEMDGYEAAKKIRQFEDRHYGDSGCGAAKQTPIIAMTANVSREDIEKCMEAGMNDHIGLPLDIEEVLKKLRSCLNNL
jgi:CheY-like chemotaxis protein